jgi:hypothetical protein
MVRAASRPNRFASNSATSAISSADWPGALARIPRYRASTLSLNGRAGSCELGDQLAMRKKRGQSLLCHHAVDVLVESAARRFSQFRSHAVM